MSEKEQKQNVTKEAEASAKPPKFTITHGMVPDIYVPAWKTNVVSSSFVKI